MRLSKELVVTVCAVTSALAVAGCGGSTTKTSANPPAAATKSSATPADTPSSESSTPEESPSSEDEPTEEETSEDAPQDLTLGSSVTVTGTSEDKEFELSVALDGPKLSKSALSDYGDKPEGQYVGYLVTYTCKKGSCSYNPYDWTVRSDDGEEAEPTFGDSFEPDLKSGDLRAGRKAKGYITYDLKPGTYYLEYSANFFDDDSASWKHVLKK